MTTLVQRTEAPGRAAVHRTLRTLAGVEARRYARHPLFLIGVALMVWVMVSITKGLADGTGDAQILLVSDGTTVPAFFLGVLGVFVGHRLTRSMARSSEAVEASPADGVTRTAALCLACLVPGAVAMVWLAWNYVAMAVWPGPYSAAISSTNHAAMLSAGVVYAVGGPLFGVMVGRWTRFPGAGLVAAVVLVGWALLGTFGLLMSASRIGTLVHLNAPFTTWVSSDSSSNAVSWVAGGAPGWYLAYVTLLCGVAASAAMLHEARGAQRSRLVRIWAVLLGLALVALALAAAADPARILLPRG
jgi:hypothetical protein